MLGINWSRRREPARASGAFVLDMMADVVNADLPGMFDRLIRGMTEYFEADHACIHLEAAEALADPVRRAALHKCPVHKAEPEDLEPMVRAEAAFGSEAQVRSAPITLQQARRHDPTVDRFAQLLRLRDGLAIPLIYQGELYGVLNVYTTGRLPDHDPRVFAALGGVLYGAVKRELMLRWLRERDGSVDLLARMVEARDPYTGGHAGRVRSLSGRLAELWGLTEVELRAVDRAALLHDIGKVGVPDRVLCKPGPLDAEERRIMEQHTVLGRKILSGVTDPEMAAVIAGVTWHHERPDGRGYPDGRIGDDIPLVARIIAVADVFDALVSDRPYRPGMPLDRALAILREVRGTQLDATLVDLFLAHEVWRVKVFSPGGGPDRK